MQHFELTLNLWFRPANNPQNHSYKRSITLAGVHHHVELQNQDMSF